MTGKVRIDVASGDRTDCWLVSINKGDLAVTNQNVDADCVIRTSKEVFDRIASGEANASATVLRGAMDIQGNAEMLILFQRLFPSPPGPRQVASPAGYARRLS
jgi:hypothetical protein